MLITLRMFAWHTPEEHGACHAKTGNVSQSVSNSIYVLQALKPCDHCLMAVIQNHEARGFANVCMSTPRQPRSWSKEEDGVHVMRETDDYHRAEA